MKWHPYSKLFPMMGESEIESLAEDIRKHGQRLPALVDKQERVIDGRNRIAACALAGVEPKIEVFEGDDAAILELVLSLNLPRRHLNESQRAMVAAEVANLRQGSNQHEKGTENHKNTEKTEPLPIGRPSPEPVSVAEAAKKLNVSERSVHRAKAVKEKAVPAVQEAVRSGKVSVTKAAKIAEKPPEEQAAALERPEPEPADDGEALRDRILDRIGPALEKSIRELCDTEAGRNVDRAKALELLGKLVAAVRGEKQAVHPQGESFILEFPCDGKPNCWRLTEHQVSEWAELFPSLDIVAQCRSALAWVKASKDRQKTFRGMPKFLVGWFSRSQDSGKHRSSEPRDKLSGLKAFVASANRGIEVSPGVELIGGPHDFEE